MEQQIENEINYEYVKNILISYFGTNDYTVHAKLIKVVFIAMKFTQEEQQKVKDAFTANNTSYLGKMMGGTLF